MSQLMFQQEVLLDNVPKVAADNAKGKVNGVTLAVVIILLIVVVVVILLFLHKRRSNMKKSDVELM